MNIHIRILNTNCMYTVVLFFRLFPFLWWERGGSQNKIKSMHTINVPNDLLSRSVRFHILSLLEFKRHIRIHFYYSNTHSIRVSSMHTLHIRVCMRGGHLHNPLSKRAYYSNIIVFPLVFCLTSRWNRDPNSDLSTVYPIDMDHVALDDTCIDLQKRVAVPNSLSKIAQGYYSCRSNYKSNRVVIMILIICLVLLLSICLLECVEWHCSGHSWQHELVYNHGYKKPEQCRACLRFSCAKKCMPVLTGNIWFEFCFWDHCYQKGTRVCAFARSWRCLII